MKSLAIKISTTLLTVVILSLVSCSDSSEGSTPVEQTQLGLLSKTWTIQSAMQTVDRTNAFSDPDMTLTVSGAFNASSPKGPYNYSIAGTLPTPSPWAAGNGSWSFGADATKQIIRDDGVEINYTISGNELTLSFTCITCDEDNSRTNSSEGGWVFVFTTNP